MPGWSNVLNLAAVFVALSLDFNIERQGKEKYGVREQSWYTIKVFALVAVQPEEQNCFKLPTTKSSNGIKSLMEAKRSSARPITDLTEVQRKPTKRLMCKTNLTEDRSLWSKKPFIRFLQNKLKKKIHLVSEIYAIYKLTHSYPLPHRLIVCPLLPPKRKNTSISISKNRWRFTCFFFLWWF